MQSTKRPNERWNILVLSYWNVFTSVRLVWVFQSTILEVNWITTLSEWSFLSSSNPDLKLNLQNIYSFFVYLGSVGPKRANLVVAAPSVMEPAVFVSLLVSFLLKSLSEYTWLLGTWEYFLFSFSVELACGDRTYQNLTFWDAPNNIARKMVKHFLTFPACFYVIFLTSF